MPVTSSWAYSYTHAPEDRSKLSKDVTECLRISIEMSSATSFVRMVSDCRTGKVLCWV